MRGAFRPGNPRPSATCWILGIAYGWRSAAIHVPAAGARRPIRCCEPGPGSTTSSGPAIRRLAAPVLSCPALGLWVRARTLLSLDPQVGACIQQVERQYPAIEHLVMEGAQIEARTECFPGAHAELAELQLSELVGKSLCRPRDVAIGFALNRGLVDRSRFTHEVHHLIARPSLGVDTGIDHEAHRAEQLAREPAVIADRILVEPDFLAELLG